MKTRVTFSFWIWIMDELQNILMSCEMGNLKKWITHDLFKMLCVPVFFASIITVRYCYWGYISHLQCQSAMTITKKRLETDLITFSDCVCFNLSAQNSHSLKSDWLSIICIHWNTFNVRICIYLKCVSVALIYILYIKISYYLLYTK